MKDEDEGPSIARFIETLDPADQKHAIEEMMGLLVLDEQADGELHERLKSLL